MADTNRTSNDGKVRASSPDDARQDPENLERQRQVERDRDALEAQADRVEATAPPEVHDKTIGEMTEEAERKAEEDKRR